MYSLMNERLEVEKQLFVGGFRDRQGVKFELGTVARPTLRNCHRKIQKSELDGHLSCRRKVRHGSGVGFEFGVYIQLDAWSVSGCS